MENEVTTTAAIENEVAAQPAAQPQPQAANINANGFPNEYTINVRVLTAGYSVNTNKELELDRITITTNGTFPSYDKDGNPITNANTFSVSTYPLQRDLMCCTFEVGFWLTQASMEAAVTGAKAPRLNPALLSALLTAAKIKVTRTFHAKGTLREDGTPYDRNTYTSKVIGCEVSNNPRVQKLIAHLEANALLDPRTIEATNADIPNAADFNEI